jgi:hypothetical protein
MSLKMRLASEDERLRISAASKGKAKTCAVCGQPGHNKRTCRMLIDPEVQLCPHTFDLAMLWHG